VPCSTQILAKNEERKETTGKREKRKNVPLELGRIAVACSGTPPKPFTMAFRMAFPAFVASTKYCSKRECKSDCILVLL